MITIFDRTEKFPGKVNFIDEYNNLIGFDMESDCCEDFGWFIEGTDLKGNKKSNGGMFVLDKYNFKTRSLQLINTEDGDDEGGEITIKLTGLDRSFGYFNPKRLPILTLHIFNRHNGYYSHGFELSIDDEKMVCSI